MTYERKYVWHEDPTLPYLLIDMSVDDDRVGMERYRTIPLHMIAGEYETYAEADAVALNVLTLPKYLIVHNPHEAPLGERSAL